MRAVLVILCLLITEPGQTAGIVLANGGKASARIICQTKHPIVKQAVADLSLYLGKVTGADFSKSAGTVEIEVLDSIPADAPQKLRNAPEGYWIAANGNTIRIVGGSPVGTAYGVYRFLEKYAGVRWFLPAPDGEYIPRIPTLTVPAVSEFSKPAFQMRWVGTGIWALRNGSNSTSIGQVIGPDGKEVTAGYRFEPGIYHTQAHFLPVSEYFEKQPDYYALVRGERRNLGKGTKLCTSNAEVVREVARNMGRYLDEHPGVDVISLSPTDHHNFCECPNCRALDEKSVEPSQTMSRRTLIFYNTVATELRKTHPEAKIAVGAYSAYTRPPDGRSLKLLPDMYVVLCHYVPACLAHPVNDPSCPANRDYNAILKGWLDRSSGVYFFEYYWKLNWFGLPWPVIHTIAADIPYYHRIGVKGLFTQFSEQNAYTLGLNYYIAAKLMWNPKADVRKLVNEYYEKYFAESAGPMREYYEMLQKRMSSVQADIPGDAWTNGTKVYDAEFLSQLQGKLDEAMRLARTDTTRRRIERHRKHLDYTRRLIEGLVLKDSDPAAAYKKLSVFIEDYRKSSEEWEGIVFPTDCVHFLGTRVQRMENR